MDKIPFIYLDLSVGANLRRLRMWKLVVEVLEKTSGSWRNKFVSLGKIIRVSWIVTTPMLWTKNKPHAFRGPSFFAMEYMS
ncbi:hypothetical protein MTR_4g109970 [Medicago truncatula]|uniref:Uncharacterized protein n=1 Tax=Medicago truncatula TaxID=3880 RepID=A0A072URS0_MEDTR|nr:hypothetical protein MTR_4g109970 [Medicago truncatula]